MTKNRNTSQATPHRRRGFTAIELTAVASIIAILALILIPIVRKRLEATRLTAALDDMRSLETAETLANADTAHYFRLSDLDNPAADLDTWNNAASTPAQKAQAVRSVPNGYWNAPLTALEQASATQLGTLAPLWNGPYTTFNKTKFLPLSDFQVPAPPAVATSVNSPRFRLFNLDSSSGVGIAATTSGPIPIFMSASTSADPFNDDFANGEETPVDPWGAPYIFFGPGKMGTAAGQTALTLGGVTESNFGTAIIYSTGPDGLPGVGTGANSIDYFRETSLLGGGDDLWRIF